MKRKGKKKRKRVCIHSLIFFFIMSPLMEISERLIWLRYLCIFVLRNGKKRAPMPCLVNWRSCLFHCLYCYIYYFILFNQTKLCIYIYICMYRIGSSKTKSTFFLSGGGGSRAVRVSLLSLTNFLIFIFYFCQQSDWKVYCYGSWKRAFICDCDTERETNKWNRFKPKSGNKRKRKRKLITAIFFLRSEIFFFLFWLYHVIIVITKH